MHVLTPSPTAPSRPHLAIPKIDRTVRDAGIALPFLVIGLAAIPALYAPVVATILALIITTAIAVTMLAAIDTTDSRWAGGVYRERRVRAVIAASVLLVMLSWAIAEILTWG